MKKEDHTYFHDRLRNQYIKLGTKEIRKLNRREQTLHKRLEEYQLEYDVQMALLNKRMYKTRSNNVRKVCKTEKKQLNSSLNTLKQQIRDVQLEKRKVAYSLSVFL
jgi:DNA repair exonuclease SbcCD ATPase subunit